MKKRIVTIAVALVALCGCQTSETSEMRAQRIADDHRRQAENEQRGQQEGLRNRFKRYSTAELKIMRNRYVDLAHLNTTKDAMLNPAASAIWGNNDRRNAEQLIEVERELLRRWKSGDADAHLPEFDSKPTS